MRIVEAFYDVLDIDDFKEFNDYSEYYIRKYVSSDEIKKQERTYLNEVNCRIWNNAIEEQKNIYMMIAEGRYYTWPSKKVKYMFFSKKRDSVSFEADERAKITFSNISQRQQLNWKDYLACSELCASSDIVCKFHLAPWQLGVIESIAGNDDCIICIFIPDLGNNEEMIKNAMNTYGYFLLRKYDRKDIGEKWIALEFGMNRQNIINDMLSETQYMYHIAPSKYDHKISKIGLAPRNNNVLYDYPERIYMFECEDDFGKEVTDLDNNNFMMAVRFLYNEKEKTDNSYVNDKKFSIWKISVKDILHKVNFYIDVSQEPITILGKGNMISLYTEDNIPPAAVERMFEIELKTK